jgi:hypothetical protein
MDITKYKALSIRQPWCHRILHEGKDVENRDWPTHFRGDVLIHAAISKSELDRDEYDEYQFGGIVGIMEIVDCVTKKESPWFFGAYGFVIRNARPIELIPCVGALSFFTPDPTKLYKPKKPYVRKPPKAPKANPQQQLWQ